MKALTRIAIFAVIMVAAVFHCQTAAAQELPLCDTHKFDNQPMPIRRTGTSSFKVEVGIREALIEIRVYIKNGPLEQTYTALPNYNCEVLFSGSPDSMRERVVNVRAYAKSPDGYELEKFLGVVLYNKDGSIAVVDSAYK